MFTEINLHISHQLQSKFCREDTSILCLVFFENIRLNSTSYKRKCSLTNLVINLFGQYPITTGTEQAQPESAITFRQLTGVLCIQINRALCFRQVFLHPLINPVPFLLLLYPLFTLLIDGSIQKEGQ